MKAVTTQKEKINVGRNWKCVTEERLRRNDSPMCNAHNKCNKF